MMYSKTFKIAFWVILHQIYILITRPVPNAAGNYKLHVLMHTKRQNLGGKIDFFESGGA